MSKIHLIQDDPEFLNLLKQEEVITLRNKYPILFDNKPVSDKRKEFNKNRSKLKKQIIERDGNKCKVCGNTGEQIDHIIPLANNIFNKENGMKPTRNGKVPSESFGSNDLENLRWICKSCNRKKWIYFNL